jgi:hypothetical protein
LMSGRILRVGLITRPEESYHVLCIWTACGREVSIIRRPWLITGCCATEYKNKIEDNSTTYFTISRTVSPTVRGICSLTIWIPKLMCYNDYYSLSPI